MLLLLAPMVAADAQRASDLEVGGAFMLSAVALAPLDGRVHEALAAVFSAESARQWRHAGWVGPVAYAGAGTAGLARLYLNKHWLSDVLAGAGIGIGAGLVVTHFSESHPHNALDRAFLP